MSMVGYAVVYVLENARELKYLKVISLVVFLRFFYTLLWKPLNSGFGPRRGKFMVYARKPLIYAGLLNTMVTQSYLNNLIETCPQITRNRSVGFETGSWVRISPPPPVYNAVSPMDWQLIYLAVSWGKFNCGNTGSSGNWESEVLSIHVMALADANLELNSRWA